MYNLNYSNNQTSLCYKDVCLKVAGSLATAVAIGATIYFVAKAASTLLNAKN
jgi:hypothetical protein